jgi:thiol-disulfide isomerase/thioredoxin
VWAAALALILAGRSGRAPAPALSPAQAATAADASVRLVPRVGGGGAATATLAAYAPGGRPTRVRIAAGGGDEFLDFFATWCHACGLDMRVLTRYQRLANARGLAPVVAVDLRLAEASNAYVRSFALAHALPFPVALDATGRVTDAYGVTALPTLVLVAPGGRVLWRETGVVDLAKVLAVARAHAADR